MNAIGLRHGEVYRDPRSNDEPLMVRSNAPRWIAMLEKHGIDPTTRAATA